MNDNQNDDFSDNQEAVFDWKKNSTDKHERMALNIDAKAVEKYREKKDNSLMKAPRPENLALGLKKLRKKVREVYDEDDDEEEETIFAPLPYLQEEENPLLNALTEDEKRLFWQKNTIENTQMQQTAGKMEALQIADNLAKEVGFKKLDRKTVNEEMNKATFRPQEMQEKVIRKEVSGKLGIKGDIAKGKILEAARGIKKVEQLGGKEAAKNLDMRDIIKAGEEKLDEIKLAEMILEKSGQDIKKRKKRLQEGKDNLTLKHFKQPVEKNKQKKRGSDLNQNGSNLNQGSSDLVR